MAKTMARIENNVVVNVEWHSDRTEQTDTLVEVNDKPVMIGDTYNGVDFLRDGEKVLSEVEELRVQNEEYAAIIDELYAEVTAE